MFTNVWNVLSYASVQWIRRILYLLFSIWNRGDFEEHTAMNCSMSSWSSGQPKTGDNSIITFFFVREITQMTADTSDVRLCQLSGNYNDNWYFSWYSVGRNRNYLNYFSFNWSFSLLWFFNISKIFFSKANAGDLCRFGMKSRKNTIYQLNNNIATRRTAFLQLEIHLIEALDAHLPTFDRTGMAKSSFLYFVCQWEWKLITIIIYRE